MSSRAFKRSRRADWFAQNGPCARCGSRDNLELDHIARANKVSHRIFDLGDERREAELTKCQVLCHRCHVTKTNGEMRLKRFFPMQERMAKIR